MAINVEEFLSLQPMFPPKYSDNFSPEGRCSEGLDAFSFLNCTSSPLTGGCSEGLDAFIFFLNNTLSPLTGGCSEGLHAFRFLFKQQLLICITTVGATVVFTLF